MIYRVRSERRSEETLVEFFANEVSALMFAKSEVHYQNVIYVIVEAEVLPHTQAILRMLNDSKAEMEHVIYEWDGQMGGQYTQEPEQDDK